MRLRKIKAWGGTQVVPLTASDMKDLDLKIGDEVDVSDLIKKGGTKKCKK